MLALLIAGNSALAQAPYQLTVFDSGNASNVTVADINNAGQVVMSVDLLRRVMVWDGFGFTEVGPGSATGINDRGEMVGTLGSIPVLWTGGTVIPLPGAGAAGAPTLRGEALDINNRGQIVGYDVANSVARATVWENGSFAQLSIGSELGVGVAYAINELGHVVGSWQAESLPTAPQAAVWDDRGGRLLEGPVSYAHDINDRGQIVGMVEGKARLWSDAGTLDLGAVFGAEFSSANAINEAGLVVGYRTDGGLADKWHAVLWNESGAVELNTLVRPGSAQAGWWLTEAYAVNDNSDIVGRAVNRLQCTTLGTCQSYGFLLSPSDLPDRVLDISAPIPEPSTYALMLAGLGCIVLVMRRRRL